MIPEVETFLKIDTDERGTCRLQHGSRCVEADNVFSLSEQRNDAIEADGRQHRIEVAAGHVEIVEDRFVAPIKLIAILQKQGAILPTPLDQRSAFNELMTRLYEH